MTTQHTPTPWRHDPNTRSHVVGANGRSVASFGGYANTVSPDNGVGEDQANADFSIQAVNSHDALLVALREVHLAIIKEGLLENDMAHHDRCLEWRILKQKIINAIKLAKEGAA